MKRWVRVLGIVSGIISFILCIWAGLWILTDAGFDRDDDVLITGIGLYFLGKAFFVRPMLILASMQEKKE